MNEILGWWLLRLYRKTLQTSQRVRYEEARAQIDLDAATIQLQQAQLAAAEVNLDYTNIVSPIDGIVIARNVATGETVAASYQTPRLFTIANDPHEMRVYAKVAEADIGRLKVGQAASFTLDAYPERTFASTILRFAWLLRWIRMWSLTPSSFPPRI